MAVNFGLLQPIQPPQIVGSVPAVPAQPGIGAAMGGLMEGLSQGQQMQLNQKKMRDMDQQYEFNQQNNPTVLKQNQTNLERSKVGLAGDKIDLKTKQQAYDYAQQKLTAGKQSENAYLSVLNPDDRINYLNQKAQYQQQVTKASQGKIENSYLIMDSIGVANSAAMQYQDPAQREKAYQTVKQTLPPDVQKYMSPHFDPQFAPIAISSANEAQSAYLISRFGSKGQTTDKTTNDIKNAQRIAELSAKPNRSPQETVELQTLQQAMPNNAEKTTSTESQKDAQRYAVLKNNHNKTPQEQTEMQVLEGKLIKSPGLFESLKQAGSNFLFGESPANPEAQTAPSSSVPNAQTQAPNSPVAPPQIPAGRIAVQAPDGTIGHIPAAQLNDALKSGYKQVQ